MNTLKVKFPSTAQLYSYFTSDNSIVVGDHVVVDTPREGLVVVEVKYVHFYEDEKAVKPIVCKVDVESYKANKAFLAKKEEAKKELEVLMKEFKEAAMYDLLAARNPRARELLSIIKGQ